VQVPVGGSAAITVQGVPILSKVHGGQEIRLHVALHFSDNATVATGDDVDLAIEGSQPAIVFEDEVRTTCEMQTICDSEPVPLSLVRPVGVGSEVHLLRGRLLLRDGTDASLGCDSGTDASWAMPEPFLPMDFGLLNSSSNAVITLHSEQEGGQPLVTLTIPADAGALTIGGATRLMVDGIDVRGKWGRCEGFPQG